jgi:hypothetical protein
MPSLSEQRGGTQANLLRLHNIVLRGHASRIILYIILNLYKVWRASRRV